MRMTIILVIGALGACSSEGEPQQPAAEQQAQAPSAAASPTAPVQTAALMAIPGDPQAVKRLEAMGYTVHREEGHLHAPGVKGCPAMADGPVM